MEKEIYKLIEESVRDYIHELRVWGNLLNKIPKAQFIKQKKKKKMDLITSKWRASIQQKALWIKLTEKWHSIKRYRFFNIYTQQTINIQLLKKHQ